MPKSLQLIKLFIVLVVLVGCNQNTNPPEYIKQVVSYKEGSEGLVLYAVLADKYGVPTSADGTFYYIIRCHNDRFKFDYDLWKNDIQVKSSDFKENTIGIGAFKRDLLLYSFGRFDYNNLESNPWKKYPGEFSSVGLAKVTFIPKKGKPIRGESIVSF